MTNRTRKLEEKFNSLFPLIEQAEPGKTATRPFDREKFIKSAKELQKIVKQNDCMQSINS